MDVIVQVVGIAKLNAEAILIIIGVGRALHKHYISLHTTQVTLGAFCLKFETKIPRSKGSNHLYIGIIKFYMVIKHQ